MSSTTAAAAAAPRPKREPVVTLFCGSVNLRWGTFGVAFLAVLLTVAGNIQQFVDNTRSTAGGRFIFSVVLGCSLGTLIFRLCGMYGAWKNKLMAVKMHAIVNWVGFILFPIDAWFLARLLNLLIRRFQFFILVGSLALVFALTIYFNICVYSYYMELRDWPERYDIEPEDLEEIQIINNPEIKFITKEVFVQPKA